ncbi:MAG: hypothetical protein HFI37_02150 [Lachnospiraceae bacterium]|nr:hypothetical protein [Lachnospiraceae bacterium]
MDTIKNYLENMFFHLPKTEEVLRAKAELGEMMEDKYYELLKEGKTDNEAIGIVITEFGNLKELSKELGIDDIVNEDQLEKESKNSRIVTSTEVNQYLEDGKKFFQFIGFGVMLCIYSPLLLIFLESLTETNILGEGYQEKLEACIGIPFLFIFVAIAVGIFIYQGMKFEKYDYLKKEFFSLEFGVEEELKLKFEDQRSTSIVKIIAGVVLSILSVLPLIIIGEILNWSSITSFLSISFLFIVGIAVFLLITGGGELNSYHVILQDGDYTISKKNKNKFADKIGAIYWPIITCIYLIWSFSTMNWGFTWIIWPVAGVLFGVIGSICSLVKGDKEV